MPSGCVITVVERAMVTVDWRRSRVQTGLHLYSLLVAFPSMGLTTYEARYHILCTTGKLVGVIQVYSIRCLVSDWLDIVLGSTVLVGLSPLMYLLVQISTCTGYHSCCYYLMPSFFQYPSRPGKSENHERNRRTASPQVCSGHGREHCTSGNRAYDHGPWGWR